jgi:NAD(P)-dependent dehydrogenase (short-subunit alcohol dehydrogenase family)
MAGGAGERVAIVTGGATGIGLAVSKAFVAEGTAVVIGSRNAEVGEGVAADLRSGGGRATFIETDVAVAAQVEALVRRAVDEYGRLDVLVNNSGVEADEGFDGPVTEAGWDLLFDVNAKGTWLGSKFALPHLLETKGAIVNNASVAALVGSPGHAAYAASKAAVVSLTKSMALAYAEQGVRVNAICAGPILTEMTRVYWESEPDEAGKRRNLALCPARRAADPDEVASLVLYLASPAAAFITGAAIPIDGAKSAGLMTIDRYRW